MMSEFYRSKLFIAPQLKSVHITSNKEQRAPPSPARVGGGARYN
jgi:hypothetical protein